jgi:hypothetical protein
MKTLTLFLSLVSACAAQTTWMYGMESNSALCSPLFGDTPTPGCAPKDFWKAGIWVSAHNTDPSVFGYYITATATLADGSASIQEGFAKRGVGNSVEGWGTAFLWFGKAPSDFTITSVKVMTLTAPLPAFEQAIPAAGVMYQAAVKMKPLPMGLETQRGPQESWPSNTSARLGNIGEGPAWARYSELLWTIKQLSNKGQK